MQAEQSDIPFWYYSIGIDRCKDTSNIIFHSEMRMEKVRNALTVPKNPGKLIKM